MKACNYTHRHVHTDTHARTHRHARTYTRTHPWRHFYWRWDVQLYKPGANRNHNVGHGFYRHAIRPSSPLSVTFIVFDEMADWHDKYDNMTGRARHVPLYVQLHIYLYIDCTTMLPYNNSSGCLKQLYHRVLETSRRNNITSHTCEPSRMLDHDLFLLQGQTKIVYQRYNYTWFWERVVYISYCCYCIYVTSAV